MPVQARLLERSLGHRTIRSVARRGLPNQIQKQVAKGNRPVYSNAGHTVQRHAQVLRLPLPKVELIQSPSALVQGHEAPKIACKPFIHNFAHPQLRSHRKVTCGCPTSMIEEGNKKRLVGEDTHGNDDLRNKPGALAQSLREPADMQVS